METKKTFGQNNRNGKEDIPLTYKSASSFENGKAKAGNSLVDEYYIDKTGKEIKYYSIPPPMNV